MDGSVLRLLQGMGGPVSGQPRLCDVTTPCSMAKGAHSNRRGPVGGHFSGTEPAHSRCSIEVERPWPASGSMPGRPRRVWSELLTFEEWRGYVAWGLGSFVWASRYKGENVRPAFHLRGGGIRDCHIEMIFDLEQET